MAADDEPKDAGSDPWSSIESEGLPDLAGEFGFSFDDAPAGDAEPAADDASDGAPTNQAADVADAEIDSWLDEPADEASAGDAGAGDSAVQIGTGESGISSPSSVDGFDESADETGAEAGSGWDDTDAGSDWGATDGDGWSQSAGAEEPSADDAAEPSPDVFEGTAEAEDQTAAAADGSFTAADDIADEGPADEPAAADAMPFAAAAGRSKAAGSRAKPKRRKAGGIGQMVGVVLGGAMAIPITMAILIWGLQRDPFKVHEIAWVQEYGGFLLPENFRDGVAKKPGPKQGGSPLDQLGTIVAPAPEPTPDAPPEPVAVEPDPLSVVSPPVEPPPPVPPAPPEPEPLDTSALDGAVAAASTALDALLAVEDSQDKARTKLLTKCYKSLAKMADELAKLERTAADSGRPLTEPPKTVEALYDRLADQPAVRDDLAGLSVAWLKFSERGSDGIILQVTFDKSRRVGPYWCSAAKLQEPGGARDVTLISRTEPSTVRGDVLVVTGLVMDDNVIWAADLRPAQGTGGLSAP